MLTPATALDIESCSRCPHLILPGDEVLTVDGEMFHVEHENILLVDLSAT